MTGAEIAIIGMAGRFPGAANVREFWNNLIAGKESIRFLSDEELRNIQNPALTGNPDFVPAKGGHLDNIDWFDAAFFNYTPKEAEIMDPQFRLFHECVWNALEDAGYAKEAYDGRIGLYAGASGNFQWQKKLKDSKKYANRKGLTSIQFVERDFLPTLLSYNLNLKGPSFNVQTACSTSLVSIHLACQAILNGECDIALAGGVSVSYGLDQGYVYQQGSIFSPDGHCRAFDANAKGCIHGSGAGVVVLKLLEDALAADDHIYAVIRGSAINNDGKRKVGFTAPSIMGQFDVIKTAHQVAEVEPADISYIEAHGTGTEIGDPIEMEALKMLFENSGLHHCGIGSVKTNVGHLDAAAGVTGVIKTVLAMQHNKIPPSLNFESPNPKIDFKNSAFYVVDKLKEWEGAKIAGVSSFGIGGTNAHVVLEEAPEMQPAPSGKSAHLMVFSAKTKKSLESWVKDFSLGENVADIAYTLQNGRRDFKYRGFAVCEDNNLGEITFGEASNYSNVFMFPGQGSQYVRMGFDLFKSEPLFRDELKSCFEIYDLESLVYPPDGRDTSDEIAQTAVTQPLLFMFEYALARTLMKLGVQPNIMIGHSIGEYAAACISGVIDLKDAIKLVVKRGQLIQQLPKGSMLSVMLDENAVQPYLNEQLSLAVVNSTATCVVSGPVEEITKLQQKLLAENISSTLLKTSHAFHSFMMEPAMAGFRKSFEGIRLKSPQIPFISNVTGDFITNEDAVSPDYWVNQLRHTVRFAAGIERIMEKENVMFIEAGPGNSLSNFVLRHTAKKETHKLLNLVRNIRTAVKDDRYFYEALGKLWLLGVAVNFKPLYAGETRRKIFLPTYCYDRIQLDSPDEAIKQETTEGKRPLTEWFYTQVWQKSPTAIPFVNNEYFNERQWIVFTKENTLSAALTRCLPAENIITVQQGEKFDLDKLDNKPLNIIFTWSLNENEPLSLERCSRQMDESFYPLLDFVRALGFRKEPVHLTILTNNSFNVTGDELFFPENAAYSALVKILPLEYKNFTCQLIDVLPGADIGRVLSILSRRGEERIIALRGHSEWTPLVKPVSIEHYPRYEQLLSNEKVYVVLGLGGMGVYMAKYIAENFRSTVVIIHRNPLPPKGNRNGQLAIKMQLLDDVKGIHLLQADITNFEAMSAAVREIENTYGAINGIIHAAGVIDKGGIVQRRSNESIAESINSKVTGTLIIDTLFKNKELHFFMLFSSLGNELFEEKYGEIGYNIANEFLDAYVQSSSGIKNKICINWCDWQEVGMAMKAIDSLFNSDESKLKEMEQFNAMAIHPREGVEAFVRVCNSSLTRVMLYPFDLVERLQQRDKTLLNYSEFLEKKFRLLADATESNFVQVVKSQSMEENVVNIWKEYLGHKEISIHDNIFEIGASSLDVVQVKSIFKSQLGIDVPVTALFEYPTIHAFLKFIKGTEEATADSSERIDKGRDKLGKLKKLSNVKG